MPALSNLVALFALILVAVLGRITFRSWLHPGAFFALCWLFLVSFSFSAPLIGVEQYPVWHGAVWWMVVTLLCVYLGSLLGSRSAAPVRRPTPLPTSARAFAYVKPLLAASAVGSLVWPVAVARLVVFGDNPPLYLQVFLGLHYVAPILSGLLYAGARERRYRMLALAALLPGLFLAFVDTGRSKVITEFCGWFTGYFTMLVFLNRSRPVALFSWGRTVAAVGCIAFFLVTGVAFTTFRSVRPDMPFNEKFKEYWHVTSFDTLRRDWEWMQPSIFGHIAMFSAYFEIAWADPPTVPKFPQQTAAGLYRAFGYTPPEWIYVDVGGLPSNVFTIFKPPIEDFTLPGSLVVFFGWGIVSGWAYRRLQLGSLWPGGLLVYYYANATNIGGTFLTYNSSTGAFIIVGLYLRYLETYGRLRPQLAAGMEGERARSPRVAMRPLWGGAPPAESAR